MKIVFDARMMGQGFGIGVYVLELVKRLPKAGAQHEFIFLVRPEIETLAKKEIVGKNVQIVVADIPHYSWAEQLQLPKILAQYQPDLVHFPNFNVPLLYRRNFVVTIHDMVHNRLPGHRKDHFFHRLAYQRAMNAAVNNSQNIITISKASKHDILNFFPKLPDEKVFVIPEGVDPRFSSQELPGEIFMLREKYGITEPYVLFVGVWEVKKQLPTLAKAFAHLADKYPHLKLVLAGKEDPHHPEVKTQIEEAATGFVDRIIIPGFVDAEDLPALYRHAAVFVNPSLYEGFGLPGLEAISCGTPIVVAETQVFQEIYEKAALYFKSAEEAAVAIDLLLSDPNRRLEMAKRGLEQARKYTWEECTARTLKVYEQSPNF